MNIEQIKKTAIPACKKFNVHRLDLFGSAVLGNDTPTSDIDILVEFNNPDTTLSNRFFGLLHYLEDHLNRRIDLLTEKSLRNPYFRKRVLAEKVTIYES